MQIGMRRGLHCQSDSTQAYKYLLGTHRMKKKSPGVEERLTNVSGVSQMYQDRVDGEPGE